MGLSERIESLPPDMQAEVADFVEYLHHKRTNQDLPESITQSSKQDILPVSDLSRHSLLDVLAEAPGHLGFQSAAEVDAYIQAERNAWDS